MRFEYDVIVVGGGHAGTEAAWAASAVLGDGGRVALVTLDPARIGQMSCNPAIGGLAKGQMVREVDALGGLMGLAIDASGIMFKMLNTSKGAAVRGPRAQADKYAYLAEVQRLLATRPEIDVIAGAVEDLRVEGGAVTGIRLAAGAGVVRPSPEAVERNESGAALAVPVYPSAPDDADRIETELRAAAVVLTTGTFMRGLMHTGERRTEGGRVDEAAAGGMSAALRELGFELGRLKTGTPPRLDRASIDWDGLEAQSADTDPVPFSDLSPGAMPANRFPHLAPVECRITRTVAAAHAIIRENLDRAPMFSGKMEAECGPRYCPSIEDKVVRFADRDSHHVFLEPESRHTNEIYCNGISTSLPEDVQEQLVRLMPGCENATILRWGYAVEYDMVWPHQIDATCMTKRIDGLFLAGQINCTTGYEEAAGQGVVAGMNAARMVQRKDPVRIGRDAAYIGVMLDDLVTKTPREPYRMFTSRAEHRLHLRADNTDDRLTPLGRELGLVDDARWRSHRERAKRRAEIREHIERTVVDGKQLGAIAPRPDVSTATIAAAIGAVADIDIGDIDGGTVDHRDLERILTELRYAGYINRQESQVRRQAAADGRRIPDWLEPTAVSGLRSEAVDVLTRFRPQTLGQAGRLAGVNPADVTLLAVAIKRGPTQAPSERAASARR